MVKTERVLQYTDLKPEAPLENSVTTPAKPWPSHGHITIRDLSCTYQSDGPMVLSNISCCFHSKENVRFTDFVVIGQFQTWI